MEPVLKSIINSGSWRLGPDALPWQPNNPHHASGLSPISSTLLNIPYCLYSSRLGKPPGEVPPGRHRPPGLLLLKKKGGGSQFVQKGLRSLDAGSSLAFTRVRCGRGLSSSPCLRGLRHSIVPGLLAPEFAYIKSLEQ